MILWFCKSRVGVCILVLSGLALCIPIHIWTFDNSPASCFDMRSSSLGSILISRFLLRLLQPTTLRHSPMMVTRSKNGPYIQYHVRMCKILPMCKRLSRGSIAEEND